jgi:2-iminobutanoate/2-iminopropanoate deaminase
MATSDLVFTAGQGPADPQTGEIPEGIEAQTEAAVQNVARVLEGAGCTLADVVKSTVHLADLRDFARFDAVYARLFPEPRPVRTTVGSQLPGFLIEIDVIAVRGR